jgi:hypothetical protein
MLVRRSADKSMEARQENHIADNSWQPARTGRLSGVLFAAVAVGILLGTAVQAAPGQFEVRSASARLVNGVYFANARIDYELSNEAVAALVSGVTLTMELEIRLYQTKRFWPDEEVAALKQRYQLQFQPLTDRYILKHLNSGQQASFATLFSALNFLGRVTELPVIDAALLRSDRSHEIAIRAVLDQEDLPGPLRMFAFWRDDFSLQSDWYRWKLGD